MGGALAGGALAGLNLGGVDGNPICSRIFLITLGSSIAAMI